MFTDQKIDFPKFRRGWAVPPESWKSHYMIRVDLTNEVRSACGTLTRTVYHRGNGLNALWAEGSFEDERCKSCTRVCQGQDQ